MRNNRLTPDEIELLREETRQDMKTIRELIRRQPDRLSQAEFEDLVRDAKEAKA